MVVAAAVAEAGGLGEKMKLRFFDSVFLIFSVKNFLSTFFFFASEERGSRSIETLEEELRRGLLREWTRETRKLRRSVFFLLFFTFFFRKNKSI